MRRTWSRHAGRSPLSGQTTPNRNGLVVGLVTSPPVVRILGVGLRPRLELIADRNPPPSGDACDLTGGGFGDRCRGLFEGEHWRGVYLARECLAVADWEERVAATLHHEQQPSEVGGRGQDGAR